MDNNNVEFDFDASDIAKTMLSAELRARHAEDWAESRVAIANNRAMLAIIMSLATLFLATVSTALLLTTAINDTTTIIQRESPHAQPNCQTSVQKPPEI